MERKNKKSYTNYEFREYKYNSTKIKPNINEINEINMKNNRANYEHNNDNAYKRPKIINKLYKDDVEINNDNEKKSETELNPITERINKMKIENEKLRSSIAKRNKLISDLKDKCNEQNMIMATMVTKIDNIKKFIPEKSIKNKQNEKFEEQLAIAAVNEQIMKEICEGSDGHGVMNKLFEGDKKNKVVKSKIEQINQVYYKDNKFNNFECSICFDSFKENELLKQLNCSHIFHKECLSQWILNENKCPICNQLC